MTTRLLPFIPLGAGPADPQRVASIAAYCRLMIDDEARRTAEGVEAIRGRQAHVDLVALGIAEANLNNLALGDNAKNGTPLGTIIRPGGVPIDLHFSVGLGWLQHDSGWLLADEIVNGVDWDMQWIREDPAYSIDLLLRRPGFVVHQGPGGTFLDMSAWAAYKKSRRFVAEVDGIYSTVL